MSAYKRMVSNDGRAELEWRRGLVADRVSLTVDHVLVEEQPVYGLTWPLPVTIRLRGGGYSARITLAWDFLLTHVDSWTITESAEVGQRHTPPPPHYEEPLLQDELPIPIEPNGHSSTERSQPRVNHRIKQALEELGILEPRVAWSTVEQAFRTTARRYHPDTYAAQNLPPEMIEAAQRRFERAKAAFEFLKGQRRPM